MHRPTYSIVRQVAGWTMIVLGLIGLVLPVLQGVLFIAIGALLLAPYVRIFRRASAWLHKRYPRMRRSLKRFRHFKRPPRTPVSP